jgi:hypothetical protein
MILLGWRAHGRPGAERCLLGVVLVLGLAGCGIGHIQTLREAEEAFSRAAERENRERLDPNASLASLGESATGYRVAAQMVNDLVATQREELRRDNLLCTAYLVQAMSLWRLGEHDAAVQVAAQGRDCAPPAPTRDTTPRDRVVLYAIPALVRIDQANALVGNSTASEAEFDKAKNEIDRAVRNLEEAQRMASRDHPVRGYLMTSKLAALRVWQVAITREKLVDPKRGEQLIAFNEHARKAWLEYRYFTTCQLDRPADPGLENWRKLFQLATPETPVACDRPPNR